jgi:hypothetical protein
MVKINLQGFIILGLLATCVCLLQEKSSETTRNRQNIKAATDTIDRYKDKYDRIVSEKAAYELTAKEFKNINDSLKNVIKGYKPSVIVRYKTKIEYRDTLTIKYDTIRDDLSASFKFKDKWLSFSGETFLEGLKIDNISIYNEQNIVVGEKREGLFKEGELKIKIVNSNPNIEVLNMDGYIIKKKTPIFKKWYTWLGIGVVGGILLSK